MSRKSATKKGSKVARLETGALPVQFEALKDLVEKEGGRLAPAADLGLSKEFPFNYLSTGNVFVDTVLLRRGGFPRGWIIHIWGKPRSCKSLWLYRRIAAWQALEPTRVAVLIDTEQNTGEDLNQWLILQGVDLSRLIIVDTTRGPIAFRSARELMKSGKVGFLGFDSIGNLIAREAERVKKKAKQDDTETELAEFARLVTREIKRLGEAAAKHGVFTVLLNHVRDNIGVMYGDKYRFPGGWCLEYNVKISFHFTRVRDLQDSDSRPIGMEVRAKLDRSKISPAPVSTDEGTNFVFIYDKPGASGTAEYLYDAAIRLEILEVEGVWIVWPAKKGKWRGRKGFLKACEDDLAMTEDLKTAVEAAVETGGPPPAGPLETVNILEIDGE